MKTFDYIIVGAGSSGCALANRLSQDPEVNVLLLEAGGSGDSPIIKTPAGLIISLIFGTFNWCYNALNQRTLNNRAIFCPRGKALGGSSAINGMLYIRGQRQDYDLWAEQGNKGWSFDELLPYFKRSQHQERGASEYHGVGGPLNVANGRSNQPISADFIKAGTEAGVPFNPDFNGAVQEGIGWYQTTQKDGQRHSAAAAYLTPVMNRPNLTVITGATTAKVVFEGKKAVGVEYLIKGLRHSATAETEVILSGGAFGSPQLLLLSGVGPKAKLDEHGIEQVHELPGVGENLQEHVDVVRVWKDKTNSAIAMFRPKGIWHLAKDAVNYVIHRRGFLASTMAESGAFVRSCEDVERPDIQYHFVPAAMDDHGRSLRYNLSYGASIHTCVLRPYSRGSVSLASSDPTADPIIDLNMLSDSRDMDTLKAGLRKLDEIVSAPSLAQRLSYSIIPKQEPASDQELEQFIRAKANNIYHPVGTCKMGSDEMAVVDDELRVHGLEGLRVVDASIMPTLISGNTNAPSMVIGEKAADMILAARVADTQEQVA